MPSSKLESDNLLLTPGEPAGIGPDLAILNQNKLISDRIIVIADPDLISTRAKQLGETVSIREIAPGESPADDRLSIIPVKLATPVIAGMPDPTNAAYVIQALNLATDLCQSGTYKGLITGPIQKSTINEGGIPFSGHTEWLADRTHTEQVVMMLAAGELRVALATTHLPLRAVADAITKDLLIAVVTILNKDLITKFGINSPRILACGLNPHAGEGGHLGKEELTVIQPAFELLREQGINIIGPLPADTLFTPTLLADADVVLAMYHDQGLPVLKYQGFGQAVNVTLGLPIVRTSVDHGTALDLAGTGKIDSGSLLEAIRVAQQMSR